MAGAGPAAAGGSSPGVWDEWAAAAPLGLFILTEGTGSVKINPALREILGLEDGIDLGEEDFWHRLASVGIHPEKTQLAVRQAREHLTAEGTVRLEIQSRMGKDLLVEAAQLGDGYLAGAYGGWVRDTSRDTARIQARVRQLGELCAQTRLAAAGAAGNLDALLANLRSWSEDLLRDFLESTEGQLMAIQHALDLALAYTRILEQEPAWRESVAVEALLERLTGDLGLEPIRIRHAGRSESPAPAVRVDPALASLALRTLLEEASKHQASNLQLEAHIKSSAEQVILKLTSPHTLPLPGLAPELDPALEDGATWQLALVRDLLAAQGGSLSIPQRSRHSDRGIDLEISLPAGQIAFPGRTRQVGEEAQEGRILLAEAQPEYQSLLRDALTAQGYRVDLANDGSAALDRIQIINPDLVILARNLPGMDGLLVTQGIRRWSSVPVIMVSARTNPDDQLYAYRLGVDDYLRKPFLVEELLAKARVFITRRQASSQAAIPEVYHAGAVRIDHSLRQVWVRGEPVELTPIEYNLLVYLSRHGRQIVTYEQLLEGVWEGPEKGSRQGLFVHIRRLREKIEADPNTPQILQNKWGVGYEFHP